MNPKDNKKSYEPGKKVFDVSRPGKTPAAPGARPVITNRKTVDDLDVASKRSLMNPKQKITVKPADGNASDKPAPAAKPQPKKPAAAPPAPDSSAATPIKVNTDKKPPNKPESSPVKVKTAPDNPVQVKTADKKPPDTAQVKQASQAAPKPSEEPPRAVPPQAEPADSKPAEPAASAPVAEPMHMGMPKEFSTGDAVVSQHGKRRTIWLEILYVLAILLLLTAIANLLLDAEIIKTDLDIPYTDFFKPI